MRKKVAIILDEMSIGGIPKACAAFLNQLVRFCDVTMVMRNADGALMNLLPKEVHVVLTKHYIFRDALAKIKREKKYLHYLTYVLPYLFYSRIAKRWVKANELTAREMGVTVEGEYDCAISYHGMSITHMVSTLYSVKSKRKAAWIHGDHPFNGIHRKDAQDVYKKFDKIYCVSDDNKERFSNDFPKCRRICDVFLNLIDVEQVLEKSNESVTESLDPNFVNIVTVGRVCPEKGQDLIPEAVRILKQKNIPVKWYLVGDGDNRLNVETKVNELSLQDDISFLGAKTNPYPYMKKCDVYVQPSYAEGYCLTACEAAILQKPIVVTTPIEQATKVLVNEKTAVSAEPTSESLAAGIERIVSDQSLRDGMVEQLKELDFSNKNQIEKLLRFLEE